MNKSRYKRGFTLIELLLGVAIFSVISLSLYSTFFNGLKLSHKTEQVNKIYREARWTIKQLEDDLTRAVAYDFSNSYEDQMSFTGNNSELLMLIETGRGLNFVRYSLKEPDFGHVHTVQIGQRTQKNVNVVNQSASEEKIEMLVREEIPFINFLSGTQADAAEILSSKVLAGGLKFQYGSRSQGDPGLIQWSDSWEDMILPVGVRMEITYLDDDSGQRLPVVRDMTVLRGFWSKEQSKQ